MKLTITFVAVPSVNETITLSYTVGVTEFIRGNVFKTTRVNPGEVTIGSDVYETALNYYNAFILDYGTAFTVTIDGNVLTIEALNGSDIYNYSVSTPYVLFNEITAFNNAIHEIIFTPKVYAYPALMNRDYLITEDDFFIITEDNKKIRL